jgi:hypothetical protein
MVKASDISALIERYLKEKKFANLEALYMWSRGISSTTIAPLLRIKYGDDAGYVNLVDELSNLKITRNNEDTEDTKESVNVIIDNLFSLKCVNELLDQVTEKFKVVPLRAKYLLLVLVRSGLFAKGEIELKELQLAYNTLFNKPIDDFTLKETITDLEKIGILYGNTSYSGQVDKVIIPKYIYGIMPQIEAKLPHVVITEGKGEN